MLDPTHSPPFRACLDSLHTRGNKGGADLTVRSQHRNETLGTNSSCFHVLVDIESLVLGKFGMVQGRL